MTESIFLKKTMKRLAGATVIGTITVGSLIAFAPAANAAGGAQVQTQMTGKFIMPGYGGWYGLKDTNDALTTPYHGVNAAHAATQGEARAGASVISFPTNGSTGRITNSAGQCLYYSNFRMMEIPNQQPALANGKLKWVACSTAVETATASAQFRMGKYSFYNPSVTWTYAGDTWHSGIGVPTSAGSGSWMSAATPLDESGGVDIVAPAIAPVTAEVTSKDQSAKTAVISGTGEPGATIELSGPWGSKTVQVGNDGKWTTPISGLVDGSNPVNVKQTIGGAAYGETNLTVDFEEQNAPLTAKIDSSDPTAKTAVVSGTGQPGATIDLSGDWGTAQVEVGENGNWSTTIGGLKEGENDVHVTQTIGGEPAGETDLKVTFEASPIVNPAIAGGTAAAALAAAAFLAIRRRKASV